MDTEEREDFLIAWRLKGDWFTEFLYDWCDARLMGFVDVRLYGFPVSVALIVFCIPFDIP